MDLSCAPASQNPKLLPSSSARSACGYRNTGPILLNLTTAPKLGLQPVISLVQQPVTSSQVASWSMQSQI